MDLMAYIKRNPFFLAPMAGVTDKPFRSFMKEMGCGILTSELISARALRENNYRTKQLMGFSEDQRPYGIQIFGEDPYFIAEAAKQVQDYGVDFIDLNLGCPVNKIVKKGAGSALLKDLKTLSKVLSALRSSVHIPRSLKIRTGWDDKSRNAYRVALMAYEEGFSWISIHGRTRSQAYSGRADWNYIREVALKSPIPIIGNGDLDSGVKAVSALTFSACRGVMIGRGCLNNPWIFVSALKNFYEIENKNKNNNLFKDSSCSLDSINPSLNRLDLLDTRSFKSAIEKLKNHLEAFYDERLFVLQLKKFSAWFSSGFPNSTDFRKDLFKEKDKKELLKKIEDYFSSVENDTKPVPEYEPFLMRGHG